MTGLPTRCDACGNVEVDEKTQLTYVSLYAGMAVGYWLSYRAARQARAHREAARTRAQFLAAMPPLEDDLEPKAEDPEPGP